MAEALGWPEARLGWEEIVELSAHPDGWASVGHPEWGQFKFGHVHPDYSNVGLLIMTALAYSVQGKTSGLTPEEVRSEEVIEAFARVEQNTYHYGIQSRDLLRIMSQRGPNYLHAVTTSEAETLKTNADYAGQLRFQLVFLFPADGTYWSDQPYCILETEWVTEEQKRGAERFLRFLLEPAQQALAIEHGLRPIAPGIAFHAPIALESGTDPRVDRSLVPDLESPSAEVAGAIQDVFHLTKKKATVILVLDTSGSMQGDKITNAVASSINFVQRLDPGDEVFVMGFGGGRVYPVGRGGRAGEVGESLTRTLSGLYAEGGTPLYDAICEAVNLVATTQAHDQAQGERRLYGIVLLSDGLDTASQRTQNQMFGCLPSGEDVEGVKIFTIAYGDDADADLLLRIANRTNGKTFVGDPESIERVYNAISAEQ
jgi:Ca-activated chloride channel family protein